MPKFFISSIEWDDYNEHAAMRASKRQINDVLFGWIECQMNKGSGTADYGVTGQAEDGTRWHIVFNYNAANSSARPITAWKAK